MYKDVVVVGAGFAGLYLIHRLRGLGYSVQAFEKGSDVGGTWYWNRYPGARCDVESMQYSYSFSPELQDEWDWTERFATQSEILSYLRHVSERFDLRRDIQFDSTVTAAHYDDATSLWFIEVRRGDEVTWVKSRFCVMATGSISAAQRPEMPGLATFEGEVYHTAEWPHHDVDLKGKRVAVIGTGSSGIQVVPMVAEEAAHLTVFQRTPHFSLPSRNAPMTGEYAQQFRDNYPALREQQRRTVKGVIREAGNSSAHSVTAEERNAIYEERWQLGGAAVVGAFNDILTDETANETAAKFVRDKIRAIVKDSEVAELLVPKTYPIGTKRVCVDSGYYETFNRPNVTLVDIISAPIEGAMPKGLMQGGRLHELDVVIFATGFDAITGMLFRIDIRGRDGVTLKEKWSAGPRAYLGFVTHGFPNLFLINGPGSPSVLGNMVISIEHHVDLIAECLEHMRDHGFDQVEADGQAEDDWVAHVNDAASKTLFPRAASWYMGANIPGKPRVFMPYVAGVGAYQKICDEIVKDGFRGFRFRSTFESGSEIEAGEAAE